MTKNAERREKFRKRGVGPTLLEREWRAHLGESPNPWGGSKSADADHQDIERAGPQVMQIIDWHKKSKLEIRSMALSQLGEIRP